MSDGLLLSNASPHGYVLSNFVDELFGEPFYQQLINNFKLDQVMPMSPFVDVIGDIGRSVFIK